MQKIPNSSFIAGFTTYWKKFYELLSRSVGAINDYL